MNFKCPTFPEGSSADVISLSPIAELELNYGQYFVCAIMGSFGKKNIFLYLIKKIFFCTWFIYPLFGLLLLFFFLLF